MNLIRSLWLLAAVILTPLCCAAQGQIVTPLEEQLTNMEIFAARTGAVIVKGYTEVARLQGSGGSIRVVAQELTDAQTRQKIYGIMLEARHAGPPERENSAVLDYEEIDSLLRALDYIIRIDHTVTRLANFEAAYRTPGGLEIMVFNGREGLQASIIVGHYRRVSVLFPLARMAEFRRLMTEAKAHLDAGRQS